MTSAGHRVRILAAPLGASGGNPYPQLMAQALDGDRFDVHSFRTRKLFTGRWDVVHVHWPELLIRQRQGQLKSAIGYAVVLLGLSVAKLRGARITWTLHNLVGHDARTRRLTETYFAVFTRLVDGVVTMSSEAHRLLIQRYARLGGVTHAVVPHGNYRHVYPAATVTREQARRQLGLPTDGRVVLSFGWIRAYKLVDIAAEQFADSNVPITYVIAGRGRDEDVVARIKNVARRSDRVMLFDEEIDDASVAIWMKAADLALNPYVILNSGSAVLALTFGVPVVMPASAQAEELRSVTGTRSLHLYDPRTSVVDACMTAFEETDPNAIDLNGLEWSNLGDRLATFYEEVTDSRLSQRKTRSRPAQTSA